MDSVTSHNVSGNLWSDDERDELASDRSVETDSDSSSCERIFGDRRTV